MTPLSGVTCIFIIFVAHLRVADCKTEPDLPIQIQVEHKLSHTTYMKKLMFFAMVAIMVIAAGAGAAHAQAAESLPASQVMGQETASALQKTLTILGTVLNELNARIDSKTLPINQADISNALAGLNGSLLSIHSTVASLDFKAQALASNNIPNESPSAVASQPSVENPGAIVANTENDSVASASLAGSLNKFLWPTIIVLIAIAGIFLMRKRGGEKQKQASRNDTDERVRPEEPETFSYLPTITDY